MSDHPRIRGEHKNCATRWAAPEGSSPHTRGALQLVDLGVVRAGIIPAYAGSTESTMLGTTPGPDHPRIRGEHASSHFADKTCCGSSPHTRGAPWFPLLGPWIAADHPRIRGEHRRRAPLGRNPGGSSPHTRGAHAVGGG